MMGMQRRLDLAREVVIFRTSWLGFRSSEYTMDTEQLDQPAERQPEKVAGSSGIQKPESSFLSSPVNADVKEIQSSPAAIMPARWC